MENEKSFDEAEFIKKALKTCGIEYMEGDGIVIHGLLSGGRKLFRYLHNGHPMSKILDRNNNVVCTCERDMEFATIEYINKYGVTW